MGGGTGPLGGKSSAPQATKLVENMRERPAQPQIFFRYLPPQRLSSCSNICKLSPSRRLSKSSELQRLKPRGGTLLNQRSLGVSGTVTGSCRIKTGWQIVPQALQKSALVEARLQYLLHIRQSHLCLQTASTLRIIIIITF